MTAIDPRTIEAILFDWDGTLVDSFQADAAAYLEMFGALGIGWGMEELERHYSPDWYRVYRAAGVPRTLWAKADLLWRRAYRSQKPALLPGVRRALRLLERRYVLALVTSGDRRRVARQLRSFHLTGMFAARVCGEDAERRKPHPAPLRMALRLLRLRPEVCLYVGDAPEDIEMARRAGVRAIGVLGPFPTERRLRALRPDALLSSIEQLPGLLAPRARQS